MDRIFPRFRGIRMGGSRPGIRGRPLGSRNRASKRVARAILADFEAHQDEVLAKLRRWFAPQYVSLVSRLLPRVNEGGGGMELDDPGDLQVAQVAAALRAALVRVEAGVGSMDELESALLGRALNTEGAVTIGDLR
jgi:hypothetical protein